MNNPKTECTVKLFDYDKQLKVIGTFPFSVAPAVGDIIEIHPGGVISQAEYYDVVARHLCPNYTPVIIVIGSSNCYRWGITK